MWAAIIASVSTVMPIVAVHGRARARRALDRVDRLDDRAAVHRRARVDRVRRDARPAAARGRRARALGRRAAAAARLGGSLVRDELDVERGGERAGELEDVLPAHPRAA